MCQEKNDDEPPKPSSMRKLYIRGTVTNSAGLLILAGLYQAIPGAVLIALGLQWLVFVVHAMPFKSEVFYDLSGSLTHLAVILTPMVSVVRERTPRQLLCAVLSVVWMTRLGSFLFLRIRKDGKDERFDALKQCWLAFLGAWTLQVKSIAARQGRSFAPRSPDARPPLWWRGRRCGCA